MTVVDMTRLAGLVIRRAHRGRWAHPRPPPPLPRSVSCGNVVEARVTLRNRWSRRVRAGKMAGWTGLEPATSDVTGRRSNQLNYHPAKVVWGQPQRKESAGPGWWAVQGSNLRPPVCKTDALPLS
jgi:hypothetical protein